MTPTPSIADRMTTAAMLALAGCEIAVQILGVEAAALPARLCAIWLMLSVIRRFGLREWVLLGLALTMATMLIARGELTAATEALARGAYFAAFILLMMLLREAALSSDAVLAVGRWMTVQPPGRRFVTTWTGGHIAGILMNFGAVSLLAPLVQRGVRAGPLDTAEARRRADIRERRQLSALIRGFAWVLCWAPTTLTQVIIFAAVPGLDIATTMAMGLGLSAVMLVIGWAEDRLRWGRPRRAEPAGPFPRWAALDLACVYTLLIAGAFTVQRFADVDLPQALMTVAPLMLIGWLWTQNGAVRPVLVRLGLIAGQTIPRMARDAYTLGAAGFIGIAAASLAPTEAIAAWLGATGLPGWVVVASLPVLITLGGQMALSPMMMVVFLAAVLSALPELPAEPVWIALALSAGWSLSMTASPNATGALLIAGATGIAPTTMTWRWNGVYSLIVLSTLAVLAFLFVG